MLQVDRRIFIHFDYILPFLLIPIVVMSYFLVKEVSPDLAQKQVVYFSIGLVTFIFFFLLPIRRLLWIVPIFYWFNILLLLSVKFFGVTKLGAQRWLEIPFVHFTLQPSETMKIAFILMLGYLIKTHPPEHEEGYDLNMFLKLSIYILIPFVLILIQPDLGSALILLFVGYGVLFIIGVNPRIWISIALLIAVSAPILYNSLHDYQKTRIKDFLAEKPSYHVRQSIIAIGSGGINGQEVSEATQTQLKFLPIATSDFIFSYFVERHGFVGGVTLILVYVLIIMHLVMILLYMKGDYLIQVFAGALTFLFFFYTGVNIAMTIGYAPVVGLPLPMFSYGGSSFLTFTILIGILENLLSFRHDTLYDSIRYRK